MAPPVILLLTTTQRKKHERTQTGHSKKTSQKCAHVSFVARMAMLFSLQSARTFVLGVDVVADVQVQVCDLEVVRGLAHVVVAEQPGHAGALVGRSRRLLRTHLLGCRGRRRVLEDTHTHTCNTVEIQAASHSPHVTMT